MIAAGFFWSSLSISAAVLVGAGVLDFGVFKTTAPVSGAFLLVSGVAMRLPFVFDSHATRRSRTPIKTQHNAFLFILLIQQ